MIAMQINFRVPIYIKNEDDKFEVSNHKDYEIKFLMGSKPTNFRVCVNGFLTKQKVSIYEVLHKKIFLKALQEYESKDVINHISKKFITLDKLQNIYNKNIIKNFIKEVEVKSVLTETNRDVLTEYNLINLK